ncbi:MAG TPA: baseplate J/gp47 family protein [Sphingomicrobium sp.]|nr:baseplate J/gp47 family protein [Sphingomicrobium sp.]
MSWPSGDIRREARVARLREAAALGAPQVNGIVSVAVTETGGTVSLTCELIFAPPPGPPAPVRSTDVSITGGVRRPTIAATKASVAGNILTIDVAERGDFSTYELSLRRGGEPIPGFDALLSSIPVGFRLQCQQGFDCRDEGPSEQAAEATAPIDYLARDYEGFRRLMLDRFAQLSPGWTNPGPASLEVTLIELLAYCADRISYAQDSVATEAYLDTARRRVSAKRHARLVDYRMGEGRNARAFVHVRLRSPAAGNAPMHATISAGTRFMTRSEGVGPAGPETPEVLTARAAGAQVFEAMEPARLSTAHNRMVIHDWLIDRDSELSVGTTEIAVVDEGRLLTLAPGDFILIEEVLDRFGNSSPDPNRRHVVRLTDVTTQVDPVGTHDSGGNPAPLEILRLRWAAADALPMALPLRTRDSTDTVDGIVPSPRQPTLVARGNIVLVDHGEWQGVEDIVPLRRPGRRRFTLPLSAGPITMQPPHDPASAAAIVMNPAGRPVAQMAIKRGSDPWEIVDELFDETGDRLVLDIGDEGRAELRSGDLSREEAFDEALAFTVRYRLGNGSLGNVGAESIAHLLTGPHTDRNGSLIAGLSARPGDIELVRNPLPARLGAEPETIEEVRLRAPMAIRQPDRAVTGADYAAFLSAHPLVAGARAIEQWTGSSRAVVLMVDLVSGGSIDDQLEREFRDRLERVRLAGHLLEFRNPTLVPIEVAMRVCVRAGVARDDVLRRLSRLFSSGRLKDGTPALFHPDNFSFGDSLRLSRLYAAAQAVDGVAHVEITSLRRQGVPADDARVLDTGTLDFGPYEIPLLANDPNFPDRGVVHFAMEGGA